MKESINCPKCDAKMQHITHQGIEVDRCAECEGIWFDILEHEDLKKTPGSEKIDKGTLDSATASSHSNIDCPKCETRMWPIKDADQPHIHYEKCSICSGVFFDAGEFKDFKEFTLTEKLKSWTG